MTVTGPYDKVYKYIGLSTDTKPTSGVTLGSEFYERDTEKIFVYTGTAWAQK